MCYTPKSACSLSKQSGFRGHSRNRPKGGHNSPQRCTLTRFADHFSHVYSLRVEKPLQGAVSTVFCTKLFLIHGVRKVVDVK